ncbi:hypothetical protein FB451DRAFT_1181097 [Mycena latifolia]|nr:hypothetical protein FB451DRAFT_1181097 [Mycena latifolia]
MFKRRIRLERFIVADTPEYNVRFFTEVPPLVAQGKIKGQEQLFAGLENGPKVFLPLFDGTSTVKPVVVVDQWLLRRTLNMVVLQAGYPLRSFLKNPNPHKSSAYKDLEWRSLSARTPPVQAVPVSNLAAEEQGETINGDITVPLSLNRSRPSQNRSHTHHPATGACRERAAHPHKVRALARLEDRELYVLERGEEMHVGGFEEIDERFVVLIELKCVERGESEEGEEQGNDAEAVFVHDKAEVSQFSVDKRVIGGGCIDIRLVHLQHKAAFHETWSLPEDLHAVVETSHCPLEFRQPIAGRWPGLPQIILYLRGSFIETTLVQGLSDSAVWRQENIETRKDLKVTACKLYSEGTKRRSKRKRAWHNSSTAREKRTKAQRFR